MDRIDVYISYHAASSAPVVDRIAKQMENQGINCWFCPRNMVEDYPGEVINAIKSCRVFLLVMNKAAASSEDVLNELNAAFDRFRKGEEISILPFQIEEFELPPEIRYYVARVHWEDGVTLPLSISIDHLTDRVKKILSTQTAHARITKAAVSPKPYSGDANFVFISYAHKNKDAVLPIVLQMQLQGYRVWYDEGIDPGTEWDDYIASRIEDCGYMIAFISKAYLASDNCKDELNFARDLGKKRLLVYLEDVVLPRGMAMRLNRIQAIHRYKYESMESFMEKLASADGITQFR